MENKKQTKKEKIYWREYDKFLAMIDYKVFLQFYRMKNSEASWLKEIENGR